MCVGSVCTHPSYNDKNPPSVFFFFKSPFSNQAVLRFLSEWCSSVQAPPTIVDWQDRLTLDPPWVSWELSASGAGEDKMSPIKQLRCLLLDVLMNKAVVINSRHLSRWRRRGLRYFGFEGNAPIPICLNASVFVWIICDPASSTEEVVFLINLWKTFLIMC